MDPKITQEILDDLIPSLESLETRSAAVLEFLKSVGIATDEKLAPFFEKAASASNVRWLGVRVRIERLLSAAEKESADQNANEGKSSVDAASPSNQGERKAEKPAEVSRAESEADKKSNSKRSQNSENNSPENKPSDEEKSSHQSPREPAAKVAGPPASNTENGDRGGESQSAPSENPQPQKVA